MEQLLPGVGSGAGRGRAFPVETEEQRGREDGSWAAEKPLQMESREDEGWEAHLTTFGQGGGAEQTRDMGDPEGSHG